MEDLIGWFKEARNSGKYNIEVLDEIVSGVSQNGFDIDKFIRWVEEKIDK